MFSRIFYEAIVVAVIASAFASGTNARAFSRQLFTRNNLFPFGMNPDEPPQFNPSVHNWGIPFPFPIYDPLPFGIETPFQSLSNDVREAAHIIRQQNLVGFCNDLLEDGSGKGYERSDNNGDDEGVKSLFQGRRNQGTSYSSSYSNSNGNIVSTVSGGPDNSDTYTSNINTNIGGNPSSSSSHSYSYSTSPSGVSHYYINGVRVPKALQGYRPRAIEAACSVAMRNQFRPRVEPQSYHPPTGPEIPSQPSPLPPSTGPEIPSQPSPLPPSPSEVPVPFRQVYSGYGTDLPIHPYLRPGIPPVPYRYGAFKTYREACANVCAAMNECTGFTVNTNYRVNHCNLAFGKDVSRGDFIDQVAGGDGDQMYFVEGYKKIPEAL